LMLFSLGRGFAGETTVDHRTGNVEEISANVSKSFYVPNPRGAAGVGPPVSAAPVFRFFSDRM